MIRSADPIMWCYDKYNYVCGNKYKLSPKTLKMIQAFHYFDASWFQMTHLQSGLTQTFPLKTLDFYKKSVFFFKPALVVSASIKTHAA